MTLDLLSKVDQEEGKKDTHQAEGTTTKCHLESSMKIFPLGDIMTNFHKKDSTKTIHQGDSTKKAIHQEDSMMTEWTKDQWEVECVETWWKTGPTEEEVEVDLPLDLIEEEAAEALAISVKEWEEEESLEAAPEVAEEDTMIDMEHSDYVWIR